MLHANGLGTASDRQAALDWYEKAARQGFRAAQFNLGVLHATAEGAEQDLGKALHWYREAARQGDADAQYNLGILYANGEGVEQDLVRACVWYSRAAAGGSEQAVRTRDTLMEELTPAQVEEVRLLTERGAEESGKRRNG
ncbi:MAG: sel1 repeat family protein [Chromatiales bacterium]|nr:sel1 repeat family protein [Chromatiales bacterium]